MGGIVKCQCPGPAGRLLAVHPHLFPLSLHLPLGPRGDPEPSSESLAGVGGEGGVGVPGPTQSLARGLAGRLLTLARTMWWGEGVDTPKP